MADKHCLIELRTISRPVVNRPVRSVSFYEWL